MGKNNYYLDITANGKPVSNDAIPGPIRRIHGVTDEQIQFLTLGLVIGLRAKYKKPKVEIYKEINGELELYYIQQ